MTAILASSIDFSFNIFKHKNEKKCISEFDGTEGVKYIQQSDILDYLKHLLYTLVTYLWHVHGAELKNKRPPAIPNECHVTQYRLEMIMHISIERDLTWGSTWVNELTKIVCSVKYMVIDHKYT
ncbi:hypothetical protein ACJX0J_026726 [Zea mays]